MSRIWEKLFSGYERFLRSTYLEDKYRWILLCFSSSRFFFFSVRKIIMQICYPRICWRVLSTSHLQGTSLHPTPRSGSKLKSDRVLRAQKSLIRLTKRLWESRIQVLSDVFQMVSIEPSTQWYETFFRRKTWNIISHFLCFRFSEFWGNFLTAQTKIFWDSVVAFPLS